MLTGGRDPDDLLLYDPVAPALVALVPADTGEPWLSTVLAGSGRVAGVGGCVVESRAE